jgi:hypothetical protein
MNHLGLAIIEEAAVAVTSPLTRLEGRTPGERKNAAGEHVRERMGAGSLFLEEVHEVRSGVEAASDETGGLAQTLSG